MSTLNVRVCNSIGEQEGDAEITIHITSEISNVIIAAEMLRWIEEYLCNKKTIELIHERAAARLREDIKGLSDELKRRINAKDN